MEYHNPEQAKQVMVLASTLATSLDKQFSGEPPEVVFMALQMLLPVYAAHLGLGFSELMTSLAENVPMFQKNLSAALGSVAREDTH